MLSLMDCRRDLVNVAGSIVKTLFCVAAIMDSDELRDTINKLYETLSDLVLSVNDIYLCYAWGLGWRSR